MIRWRPQEPRLNSYSTNVTAVPLSTMAASFLASQFVSRIQPCDSVLLTCEGCGVPWMPYPLTESAIHTMPTGLFGPGLMVNGLFALTPLKAYSGLYR